MSKKAQTRPYKSLPDSERVTDPVRIAALLEQLAKRHELLTAEIPGHAERFTTSIVEVASPHVLLDELVPANGNQLLQVERSLQVTGRLDGVELRFITTLEQTDKQDRTVTYRMSLPEQLDYRQRRMDFRAHIPMARPLRVFIHSDDDIVTEGELHNLSYGGAGTIYPDGPPTVAPGLLHECAIELHDDVWLYCAVELCYTKPTRVDRQLIGARFIKLNPAQERLVRECVIELQRESIKKRTVG